MDEPQPGAADVSRMPLRALGLRPGMAVQTRRLVEGASKREAQYFGAIEGKGVMVGPLGPEGARTELVEGEVCVVRGFTGQYEYSFLSKVLQTFEKPFAYALLAYPPQVDARLVRQSMRIRCSWPCILQLPGADGSLQTLDVTLVDLSTGGAMVKSGGAPLAVGAKVSLTMAVRVDHAVMDLNLGASVCHSHRGAPEEGCFIGLAFLGLMPQDKLLLNYLTQGPQA